MKNLYFLLILFLPIFITCKKEKSAIKEVPDEIIKRPDASPTLYDSIINLIPEGGNMSAGDSANIRYPFLFCDTVMKEIITTDETEVYITFIAEGATYKNTVGWYSYLKSNPPTSVNDIKINVLFPNVSQKLDNGGGELVRGDMLQVGSKPFPKGTVIGFFLIVNGWNATDQSIRYSNTTLYTDYGINEDKMQHSILFREKSNDDIILGFEDLPYGNKYLDKDYNDILLKISDNKDVETVDGIEVFKKSIFFEGLKDTDPKKIPRL